MSVALALTLGVLATPAFPQDGVAAVRLVRAACVGTGMQRDAFERLAHERRWRQARITSQSGSSEGWNLVFRGDGAIVMLGQVTEAGAADPAMGSVCSVSVEDATPALQEEIALLASELGLEDEAPVTDLPPGSAPLHIWSRYGDRTLTYAAASDGRAVISLSRQIVTSETATVSPSGN